MILKVGNIIGDCLKCFFFYFYLFAIDKLDAEAGIGGFGKVFKMTNI
jgi:hypothetical protein